MTGGALVVLLALAAPAPSADEVARAKTAEAAAFVAIDEERWCDAMHLFVEANRAAPSVDLTFNAAQAADLADDRKQALKLYVELVGAYPKSPRQKQVDARIKELTTLVSKKGEGETCPPPAAPEEPAVATAASPADPPVEPEPTPGAPSTTTAPEPAAGGSSVFSLVPWVVVGLGAVALVGGAATSAVGAAPYLGFLDVKQQIEAAERTGADASALQAQQAAHRQAWQTWGEPALFTGVATTTLGLLVGAAGVAWGALGLVMAEE